MTVTGGMNTQAEVRLLFHSISGALLHNKRAMMALESLTWGFWIVWYNIEEQEFKSQPLG